MSAKESIRGKVDSAHHDGRYSNVKREQEAESQLEDYEKEGLELSAAEQWFIDTFGVPFSYAVEMSTFEGELGDHWRGVLNNLNNMVNEPVDNEPQS